MMGAMRSRISWLMVFTARAAVKQEAEEKWGK